ncbi:DNA cytosine methyltransferase [Bifidobacterium sp.]|uniref:DNA cytosine methyltransferase n=1 Tax=Bifidobacterium sp. TaxID=41200 RepID=UPI0039E8568E
MRYISLFSGIEAASVAWGRLGWNPVAFSEIEPFPKVVLAHHYPNVPDLGDITKIDWSPYVGSADVVVGGSPCQSFSIAGSRTGLDGASGLMWEYVRAVQAIRPRWFVWENVPGALSSSHGEDFRCLLESMDELGYGLAWRVLDAQFFGVAQRRRRVFLVGSLASQSSAEVLFEPESLRWDTSSSREKRQALAGRAENRTGISGGGCLTPWDTQSRRIYRSDGVMSTLDARTGKAGADAKAVYSAGFSAGNSAKAGSIGYESEIAPTIRSGPSGNNQVPTVYCASDSGSHSSIGQDVAPTLTVHDAKSASHVSKGSVRRLTPVECERLQGFPDNYTNIPYCGKDSSPDSARYKALGNSMAVPVMRWIGERIALAKTEVRS